MGLGSFESGLIVLAAACCGAAVHRIEHPAVLAELSWGLALGAGALILTTGLIPVVGEWTKAKGLFGKDLGKRGTPLESAKVPEALGLVCGVVLLFMLILGQVVLVGDDMPRLLQYTTALLSICFMLLLGFMDDVLDLKWRYKLILPTIASLPLIVGYRGATSILVPFPLRPLLMSGTELTPVGQLLDLVATVDTQSGGAIVELGWIYLLFMAMLAVFCTNAINIYAGVNGLEVGQAVVIGCAVLVTNLAEIAAAAGSDDHNHLFSAIVMFVFLGTSIALWWYNAFPSKVFVGDTFCYFAGMTIAVAAIRGHFSKTLLLFFVPQTFNFLYSIPQLLKVVECPRHRLPWVDPDTQLLHPSRYGYKGEGRPTDMQAGTGDNWTLICLVLRLLGPMREDSLVRVLLCIQVVFVGLGVWLRYEWSQLVQDVAGQEAVETANHWGAGADL